MKPRTVVLVTFPRCQLLDVSGPATVFTAVNNLPGARGYQVELVSSAGGPIETSSGLTFATRAKTTLAPTSVDLLLIPGGSAEGLSRLGADKAMKRWALAASANAERFGSVCTGAFVIAAWGLAEGRRVATHWNAATKLAAIHPELHVDAHPLFVEDGKLWTSAGVAAGIDMALAIVARDEGQAVACAVARQLVLPFRRSGNQAQHSRLLEAQAAAFGRYADLIIWLAANLDRPFSVANLADRVGQSVRSFQRHFRQATGYSPAAFITYVRLEMAQDLLISGRTVKETARACGFTSPDQLTRSFVKRYGASPSQLRPARSPRGRLTNAEEAG